MKRHECKRKIFVEHGLWNGYGLGVRTWQECECPEKVFQVISFIPDSLPLIQLDPAPSPGSGEE